jgi:hypothetical protein
MTILFGFKHIAPGVALFDIWLAEARRAIHWMQRPRLFIKVFGLGTRHFLRCVIEEKNMFEPPDARLDAAISAFLPVAHPFMGARLGGSIFYRVAPFLGLAAFFMASGCGGGAADKLEGKWVGERIDNVSAEQVARATAWVKATTLEFAGDKLTVTIPTEQPRKGTFKVAKVDGDKVVLSVHRKDSQARDETTLTLQGDKTLRWDIGQSREITLVRAQ